MEPLVGAHEAAELIGVSRQRLHALRRIDGFPAPAAVLACGNVWTRREILQWMGRSMRRGKGPARPMAPARDREHPNDDPWDADAIRYLLASRDGRHFDYRELKECLREQRYRVVAHRSRMMIVRRFALDNGVEARRDGGATIHLFRTDPSAPSYPRNAVERRGWLTRERARARAVPGQASVVR